MRFGIDGVGRLCTLTPMVYNAYNSYKRGEC
jgi:hypothetical protein